MRRLAALLAACILLAAGAGTGDARAAGVQSWATQWHCSAWAPQTRCDLHGNAYVPGPWRLVFSWTCPAGETDAVGYQLTNPTNPQYFHADGTGYANSYQYVSGTGYFTINNGSLLMEGGNPDCWLNREFQILLG